MSNEKEKGKRVLSVSSLKNIQMVVYHNVGPDGKKASITRHEPLNPALPHYKRFTKPTFTRA